MCINLQCIAYFQQIESFLMAVVCSAQNTTCLVLCSSLQIPKVLSTHNDLIYAMTMTDISLVVSGSGSNYGYAAIWKTRHLP